MSRFMEKNWLCSDDDFQYKGTCYERDRYSNRCYLLSESVSLRTEDGELVRRRISEKHFLENLGALKAALAEREGRHDTAGI